MKIEIQDLIDALKNNLLNVQNEDSDTGQISSEEFDNLIGQISARTGLDQDTASLLLRAFFEEIKNSLIMGEKISFGEIGKLSLLIPKNPDQLEYLHTRFHLFPKFKKKLNDQ